MPRDIPYVTGLRAAAYTIPTDTPEADGTFAWSNTTLVTVEIDAGGLTGFGYTYAHRAAASLIHDVFAPLVTGGDAFAIPCHHAAMLRGVRNIGRPGLASSAIAAVDTALWDLKARLLDLPLASLFGARRETVPIYGSGGFTSYDDARTIAQFTRWAEDFGATHMKMKVGTAPARDPARIRAVRDALPDIALMIDANGALTRQQALALAAVAAPLGVIWFEEPLSSDDPEGLAALRARLPAGMELAAGEYAYDAFAVRTLAEAGAVDVLQLDATRCAGYSGFLAAAAIAEAHHLPLSAHTAPALHLPVCLAAPGMRHIEWFHDHERIEAMLLDGVPRPAEGVLRPDLSRPGHGLALKHADAEPFRV